MAIIFGEMIFGAFIIYVNGTMERADSLKKALEVMDSDRYWN